MLKEYFRAIELFGLRIREESTVAKELKMVEDKKREIEIRPDTLLRKLYRRIVPAPLRSVLWKARMKKILEADANSILNTIKKTDFVITRENIQNSLDLIAVCQI